MAAVPVRPGGVRRRPGPHRRGPLRRGRMLLRAEQRPRRRAVVPAAARPVPGRLPGADGGRLLGGGVLQQPAPRQHRRRRHAYLRRAPPHGCHGPRRRGDLHGPLHRPVLHLLPGPGGLRPGGRGAPPRSGHAPRNGVAVTGGAPGHGAEPPPRPPGPSIPRPPAAAPPRGRRGETEDPHRRLPRADGSAGRRLGRLPRRAVQPHPRLLGGRPGRRAGGGAALLHRLPAGGGDRRRGADLGGRPPVSGKASWSSSSGVSGSRRASPSPLPCWAMPPASAPAPWAEWSSSCAGPGPGWRPP